MPNKLYCVTYCLLERQNSCWYLVIYLIGIIESQRLLFYYFRWILHEILAKLKTSRCTFVPFGTKRNGHTSILLSANSWQTASKISRLVNNSSTNSTVFLLDWNQHLRHLHLSYYVWKSTFFTRIIKCLNIHNACKYFWRRGWVTKL